MANANNIVVFDPYKVKLKQKLKTIDLKFQMQQFEITEDEELSDAEKDWKLRLVTKEFDHDKYWNKKMVDLYDNIMKIE